MDYLKFIGLAFYFKGKEASMPYKPVSMMMMTGAHQSNIFFQIHRTRTAPATQKMKLVI